jgi:predicted RNA-binding protein with EMAP domain
MAYTSLYYQWARGRAMVRNRAMRKARAIKARLQNARYGYWESERTALREEIKHEVRRARQAHRDWRRYRQLDAEWRAIGNS